jgi:hypothetical protein
MPTVNIAVTCKQNTPPPVVFDATASHESLQNLTTRTLNPTDKVLGVFDEHSPNQDHEAICVRTVDTMSMTFPKKPSNKTKPRSTLAKMESREPALPLHDRIPSSYADALRLNNGNNITTSTERNTSTNARDTVPGTANVQIKQIFYGHRRDDGQGYSQPRDANHGYSQQAYTPAPIICRQVRKPVQHGSSTTNAARTLRPRVRECDGLSTGRVWYSKLSLPFP